MWRPKTRHACKVPFRFVSRIACHSDSGTSRVGARLVRPAQFTRICTPPNSAQTASKTCVRLLSSVTSHVFTSDRHPRASTSATAERTCSLRRLVGITFAPACANALIRASPRSEEHTSELQSHVNLVCRLLLEKKKKKKQ